MRVGLTRSGREAGRDPARVGTFAFVVVALLFTAVTLPVVVRGAPLADDFVNCLEPQRIGLGSTLGASFERLGAVRRAHLAEIVLTNAVCEHLPFGVAIAVPLLLSLTVAVLLRSLLREIGVGEPWPSLGGALWLLQPLGTEAALWPAAMHVPLGLALSLAALLLHRRGRHGWAVLAVIGAGLSVEQVLLALPLAVWLTAPPERRRTALATTIGAIAGLLIAFVTWHGNDPRLSASLVDRVKGAATHLGFPFRFAAVGLGIHSIPLAVLWALPFSVMVLAAGAALGWRLVSLLASQPGDRGGPRRPRHVALAGLGLVALVNVPVVLNVPQQGSPRLFAPTWLVIAGVVVTMGSLVAGQSLRLWGAFAGAFAAGALLSLSLSVGVRLEHASFTASASREIAAQVPDGSVVAVCGVRRSVVEPSPRGAFAVHEFVYDWAAPEAVEYYTGRRIAFLLAGDPWEDRSCPGRGEGVPVFAFSELVDGWQAGG